MKRVLAICTRVAAEPDSVDDEYCRKWGGGNELGHRRCGNKDIALVVLHGCDFFRDILAGRVDKALEDFRAELLRQLASLGNGPCELVLAVHKGADHRPGMPPESSYWSQFFNRLSHIDLAPHRLRPLGEYGNSHPIWTSLSRSDEMLEAIFTGATRLYRYRTEVVPEAGPACYPEVAPVAPDSHSTRADTVQPSFPAKLPTEPFQVRWSKLKHAIVRQFLAFDTDLQVWEELGYGDEAAKSTIALYQRTLVRRFECVRTSLYSGLSGPSADSIEDIIGAATTDLPPDIIAGVHSAWLDLNLLLPPPNSHGTRIDSIVHQLRKADEGDFVPLKKGMQGPGGFRFCDWNHDLADVLFRIEYLLLALRPLSDLSPSQSER